MTPLIITIISLSIILGGTVLGSSFVFFFHKKFNNRINNLILGFASGIMVSAAFFGLILPSITESQNLYGDFAIFPIVVGFFAGGLFLFALDKLVPHLHIIENTEEGINSELSKNVKFFLAVTIHNIPEGLAVGFACGLAFQNSSSAILMSALSLAIGIAIQNIPEGSAVSIPFYGLGISRAKSFLLGSASGIVEPIFGLIGVLLVSSLSYIMPWLLSFAGGAMIYVTIDELLPGARKGHHIHYGIWAFMVGFVVMMALEILL